MSTSKTKWRHINKLKDKDIDYSDIPELGDDFFKHAKIVMPKNKKLVSLRLDEEVLDFFKAQGKRYQTKINAVLLAYVRSHR
jgi:uncharacterized protein (DUF4415 family)